VLTRSTATGTVSRCSNCGVEHEGEADTICCCGVRLAARCTRCGKQHHPSKVGHTCIADGCGGNVVKGPSAGLRCVTNDNRSVEFPGEIVAVATGG
jgi:hypothetical protein